jgi:hypothetical protein
MIKLSARQFEILNKLIEGESLNIEKYAIDMMSAEGQYIGKSMQLIKQ